MQKEESYKKNILVSPVVKWVGGKRQLLPEIKKYIPSKISTYVEPFL
ncbi:TPA: DNA adenine methylase, partial [Streptococcus agalactiae]|nr:DNA adenine methylase [Streptococcus agalactiae]